MNIGIPITTLLIFGYIVQNASQDMQELWYWTGIAVFATVVLLLIVRGWYYRYQQRCQVLHELNDEYDDYLKLHRYETLSATSICGCVATETVDIARRDLCTCLWNAAAALCCGALCRCWCQCCGMCAIAQQDRELRRIHPQRIDYITFEPFDHYTGKLQELRLSRETSVWKHVAGMSELSHKLLHMLGWSLVVLAIAAIFRVDNFSLPHLLVVMATLFQAFFILHFVHWRWNRFDLSLDAVIKYFSSGFVLCTGIGVFLELIVSVLLGIIRNIIVLIIALACDNTHLPDSADSAREFAKEFQRDHLWLFCIFTFLNAFVVAALIEEVTKYFGFWMMEHPDLELEAISKQSRGVGITVAMVATALGFACCENLLYVFVYTPPSIANEVATLVARSIFPVHPLAAALQSIGVCRRDLEGDRSYQLGRIILPALLLHGSFDFVLMLGSLLQSVNVDDDSQPTQGIRMELPPLISSVMIVLVGLIYYICQAEAQRLRLHELDQGLLSREGTSLLV